MSSQSLNLNVENKKRNLLEEYHKEKQSDDKRIQLRKVLIWTFIFCCAYFVFNENSDIKTVHETSIQAQSVEIENNQNIENEKERQVIPMPEGGINQQQDQQQIIQQQNNKNNENSEGNEAQNDEDIENSRENEVIVNEHVELEQQNRLQINANVDTQNEQQNNLPQEI